MPLQRGLICGVILNCLLAVVGQAGVLPDGFRIEPVADGLTEPVALASTPDQRILIAERTTGDLRQIRFGELEAAPVCSVSVDSIGEGGLVGVAVHPDFQKNGWVYLYYCDLGSGDNKITRFTLGKSSCSGALDIVSNLGSGAGLLRNGGGMAFGPDGKLYVATGDMESSGNSQDDQVLQGKVLRLEDDGAIPVDNPTPGSAIYAVGVRDGRGLTINPSGQVYVSDAGDGGGVPDELNLVAAGGNLGWDDESGMGGIHDEPLDSWIIGAQSAVDYDGSLWPELDADGLDNDHDSYGPDHLAGKARIDDNGTGVCVGSVQNGLPCTSNVDCLPIRAGEPVGALCELRDEPAEHCDALSDDDCDALGGAGIDEPDESYALDVFTAGDDEIRRAALTGAQDEIGSSVTFLDSTALPDCPTGWTGLMTGTDGHLYALATNTGGDTGALYRIVYDNTPGPREVSAAGTYAPLLVSKGFGSVVDIYWEDLRQNSFQPQDNGSSTIFSAREYTVWSGTIGSWYSHTAVQDGIEGTEVSSVVRTQSVITTPGVDTYFLVSGRSDNLNGSTGSGTNGPRPGHALTDLNDAIGDYVFPTYTKFNIAKDIQLVNSRGENVNLHQYRGHPILLDFSALWCAPCYYEAEVLEDLWDDYRDRGVKIITILMDDYSNGTDWAERPTVAECRNWEERVPLCVFNQCTLDGSACSQDSHCPDPRDHTFDCWADPQHCTGPVAGSCTGGYSQEAWPAFNKHSALPTNVVVNQALEVAYSGSGFAEGSIRVVLNLLTNTGNNDVCVH